MNKHNKETLSYVLKTCNSTLDLIRDEDDILLASMRCFIQGNLGISVNVNIKQSKYKVLYDIEELFTFRLNKIKEAGLEILSNEIQGLDRNKLENIERIKTFILDNYKIKIDECVLQPSNDTCLLYTSDAADE